MTTSDFLNFGLFTKKHLTHFLFDVQTAEKKFSLYFFHRKKDKLNGEFQSVLQIKVEKFEFYESGN